MWRKLAILLLPLGVMLTACDRAQPPIVTPAKPEAPTTSAVSSATCPEGHLPLKKVPVVYGLLMSSKELDQKVKNLEIIPGGCVIIQGYSAAYNLVCEQCQYRMDPVTEEWRKENKDPAQFHHPLSEIIREFPTKIGFQQESPNYVQHILEGRVVSEEVYCWSDIPQADLRAKIYGYFVDLGVIPAIKTTPSHGGEWTLNFNINDLPGDLNVLQVEGDKTYLRFEYPRQPRVPTLHREATVKAE